MPDSLLDAIFASYPQGSSDDPNDNILTTLI